MNLWRLNTASCTDYLHLTVCKNCFLWLYLRPITFTFINSPFRDLIQYFCSAQYILANEIVNVYCTYILWMYIVHIFLRSFYMMIFDICTMGDISTYVKHEEQENQWTLYDANESDLILQFYLTCTTHDEILSP